MKLKVKIWEYADHYYLLIPCGKSDELKKFLNKEILVKIKNTKILGVVINRSGRLVIRIRKTKEIEELNDKILEIYISSNFVDFEKPISNTVDIKITFTSTFYNKLRKVAELMNTTPEDLLQSFINETFIPLIEKKFEILVKK